METPTKIAVGLGANLGDREGTLREALRRLAEEFLREPVSSSLYETEPWGITQQPKFLNAVVVGLSEWKPPAVLNYLKTLERELGREPGLRYGPRVLDLDLLAWGERVWESEGLVVPHPGLKERIFVLAPLTEVWPGWRHPRLGGAARELLESLPETARRGATVVAPPPPDTTTP